MDSITSIHDRATWYGMLSTTNGMLQNTNKQRHEFDSADSYILDFEAIYESKNRTDLGWYSDGLWAEWGLGDEKLDKPLVDECSRRAQQRWEDSKVQYWKYVQDRLRAQKETKGGPAAANTFLDSQISTVSTEKSSSSESSAASSATTPENTHDIIETDQLGQG